MSDVLRVFLIDFIVNVFESIAGMSLILGLFRFSFNKNYFINTMIVSVVLAMTSYLMRFSLEMPAMTSFFMIAWIIVLLWRLFRIHVFFSALMAVTGYMTYITIQYVVVMVTGVFYDLNELIQSFLVVKYLQVIASVLSLLLYLFITRKRIGFTFVPDRADLSVIPNRFHVMLTALTIVSGLVICFASLISVFAAYLFPVVLGALMALLIFLNYMYEKEKTNDRSPHSPNHPVY